MKIILIGGGRKSGTTVFQSLFDGHKDIVCPPHDLNVFYAFYPKWSKSNLSRKKLEERLYEVTVKDWIFAYKKYASKEHLIKIKKELRNYFKKNIKKINFKNINQLFDFTVNLASAPFEKKKFIVLKETSSEFILPFLKKKIYFLNLLRDPRDILSAILAGQESKYKMINEDYYSIIFSTFFRYHLSHKILDNINIKNIKIYNVRFEELVKKPEKVMKFLCRKMNIKFEKILKKPTKNNNFYYGNNLDQLKFFSLSTKNISRWNRRLDLRSIKYIEMLLSDTIKNNNYKTAKIEPKYLAEIYAELNNKFFFKDRFKKKLNFY